MPNKGRAPADEITPESLGWQLRAALPPMRLHSVSLCDAEGDVLWLSEGVLGPDEHSYALEAITTLGEDSSLPGLERDLEDGRAAVFMPVRAPQGTVVGIAMILIDGKSITKGLAARLVTTQVRTVLHRIAVLLKPAVTAPPAGTIELVPGATAEAELSLPAEDTQPIVEALQLEPAHEPAPAANGAAIRSLSPLTSEQIDTILTLELTDETPAVVAVASTPEPVVPSAPVAVVEPTAPPSSQS
ncbi:MAG: hypothetical protein ACRETX_06250, partial [Steroidobacteraceae bacterium]